MKKIIDEQNKIVFFQGDWPTVMGIPFIMRREHPGYTSKVLSHDNFQKLKDRKNQS
jgi:hypothetical protein